jgi:hypothetical protein
VLSAGFGAIANALRSIHEEPVHDQFMVWTLGCILFTHAVTFLSISYFGQAIFFLYLLLGCIGSLHAIVPVYAAANGDEQDSVPADAGFLKSA